MVGLIKDIHPTEALVLHGLLACSNEVIEKGSPGVIKDRYRTDP